MTLFTMLLVMIAERLFKLGEHWHLDHRLEVLFRRICSAANFFASESNQLCTT